MKATPRPSGVIQTNPKYLTPFKFKDTIIPPDMVLVVDSREQHSPLFLDKPPIGLTVVRDCCRDGDYQIRGINNFCIEKKYYGDLYPYLSTEWETKTRLKLERFKRIIASGGWVGLLIDNRESDIFKWQEHTKVHPECIRGALNSVRMRYGVHIYFAPTKEHATRFILDSATKWWEICHEL
jgi:ERCC4-type nuclease